MRLPRPRFTIRALMVGVEIVGLLLGAWGGWRKYRAVVELSAGYQLRSDGLYGFATYSDAEAEEWEMGILEKERNPNADHAWSIEHMKGSALGMRRLADHYRALGKKYAYAARYPWLPVEPDAPQP